MSHPSPQGGFKLGRGQRLKSRKRIDLLFKEGRGVSIGNLSVVGRFFLDDRPELKAGFTVSSRNFRRAVDRNRIKRLLREAWRLSRTPLEESVVAGTHSLDLFLVYTGREMPRYAELSIRVKEAVERFGKKTPHERT